MVDGSLEELFEVHDRESIEELFEEDFKDLKECQRSLDNMKAWKASTPASRNYSWVWCPRGREELW